LRQAQHPVGAHERGQPRPPVLQGLAHEVLPVRIEQVEDVEDDLLLWMPASVLQALERRPPVLAQRDNLSIEHDLVDPLAPPRGRNAGIHCGQVLVVAGADLNILAVLDQ